MTIAFWCVLVALLLPYVFAVLSRQGASKKDYVADQRGFNEALSGWRRRAHFAQPNAFETFPGFAVAVVIAHLNAAPPLRVHVTAVVFAALGASS